ncbi:alpha/beta fold hydrolase [Nocardioides limicola]|uniref:alpha/beta fold hydrolase n=1 Tax=Nocardioides limicola TaxID=2803368 RepID=UPI0027DB3AD2|nr:alpha/beta fold hydrolase [Nocardioides sp. DJM-14]
MTALWSTCARQLGTLFHVVGWELPGHGHNSARPPERLSMADLATGVLSAIDEVFVRRGQPPDVFAYAGDSVGGAVGLQLLLESPERITTAVLVCTGGRIGEAHAWHERRALVLGEGTQAVLESSRQRWFGPEFEGRDPVAARALVDSLADTDPHGYAAVCSALADFDVTHRLSEIATPVLTVAGSVDIVTPPALLRELAAGLQQGRYAELAGVGHLAPAEAPDAVARLITHQAFITERDQ